MKIIILLSAGILILAIILISWKFYNTANSQFTSDKKDVSIRLKAIKENGKNRLKLSDSNGNTAIDHLITEVSSGGIITWELAASSNIEKIERIYSPDSVRIIFIQEAQKISDKLFTLNVPATAKSGAQEKYIIMFKHKDGSIVPIDPYIRIE